MRLPFAPLCSSRPHSFRLASLTFFGLPCVPSALLSGACPDSVAPLPQPLRALNCGCACFLWFWPFGSAPLPSLLWFTSPRPTSPDSSLPSPPAFSPPLHAVLSRLLLPPFLPRLPFSSQHFAVRLFPAPDPARYAIPFSLFYFCRTLAVPWCPGPLFIPCQIYSLPPEPHSPNPRPTPSSSAFLVLTVDCSCAARHPSSVPEPLPYLLRSRLDAYYHTSVHT